MHTTTRATSCIQRAMIRLAGIALLVATATSACGIQKQTAPDVVGPSEFALAVTLAASPDQLPRDGASQSVVSVSVRDSRGGPVSGQRLTVAFVVPTAANAQLTASELTTGPDGRATFGVIAPPSSMSGDTLTVAVTPVAGNSATAVDRRVAIGLTPSNPTAPSASFTFSPASPVTNETVRFDASASSDGGVACASACTFAWDFGDGTSAVGMIVSHAFSISGTRTVALTARDAVGAAGTSRTAVTVAAATAPTVSLAVSPSPPIIDQQTLLTATATPATGRSIVRYDWEFGDGSTRSTAASSVSKTYGDSVARVVTVTVTDDVGQTASASLRVTPTFSSAAPVAVLVVSPSDSQPAGTTFNFDAAGSTAGTGVTLTEYTFVWGDGSDSTVTSSSQATHAYSRVGTYVIRLIVKDSVGRTATTTTTATIK